MSNRFIIFGIIAVVILAGVIVMYVPMPWQSGRTNIPAEITNEVATTTTELPQPMTGNEKMHVLESLEQSTTTNELTDAEKSTIFHNLDTTEHEATELSEEEKMNILKNLDN